MVLGHATLAWVAQIVDAAFDFVIVIAVMVVI
jgi:hypothetical protein